MGVWLLYENNTRSSSFLEVCGRRWGDVVENVWSRSCRDNLEVYEKQAAASRLK